MDDLVEKTKKHFASFILIAPAIFILFKILILNNKLFIYSLDDPYIHLQLAKNIAHFHYGLSLNVVSAPASSVIWPFILALFVRFEKFYLYTPLAINFICLALSIHIILTFFKEHNYILQIVFSFICLSSLNFYGLIFTGLEHNLQLLFILITVRLLHENNDSIFLYIALVLSPLVRYEGFAISLPILGYLFFLGYRKKVVVSLCILFVVNFLFCLFLYQNIGYVLPTSVLAKSSYNLIYQILNNIKLYGVLISLVLVAIYSHIDKAFFYALCLVTCLFFVFGKTGWLGRYEVFYISFMIFNLVKCLNKKQKYILIVLPFFTFSLWKNMILTPFSSNSIYNEQRVMALISKDLGKVAVNDIGLVSLYTNGVFLDLYGLDSLSVLKKRKQAKPGWVCDIMKESGVYYAIIYDEWFKGQTQGLIKVATLKKNIKNVFANGSVIFFALNDFDAKYLTDFLKNFEKKNRSQDWYIHFFDRS